MAEVHTALCRMHLSFLLDLSGAGLEQLLGSTDNTTSCRPGSNGEKSANKLGRFSASKKHKRAADKGSPVLDLPLSTHLISCIQPLFDFLLKPDNLQQEGLFRKSGHLGRQRMLRACLSSARSAEDLRQELNSGQYSAHDVASVLKTFLGQTPEPLLTERHYGAHSQIPDLSEDKQLAAVQLLIQLLPTENVQLLRQLVDLLSRVAAEDNSRMTADTLGMLLAPQILVPRKMCGSELQEAAPGLSRAVAFMIRHPKQIFEMPERLCRDLASSRVTTDHTDCTSLTTDRPRLYARRRRADTTDGAISTAVTFADRPASLMAAAQTNTQVQLAELYAHVSQMPESAKKRKILKQFTKANSNVMSPVPEKNHKRSRSIGESLKRMVSRHNPHKRRGSACSISSSTDHPTPSPDQENQPPTTNMCTPVIKQRLTYPASPHTPRMNLLKQTLRQQHKYIHPISPKVHVVDMATAGHAHQLVKLSPSPTMTPPPSKLRPQFACRSLDQGFVSPITKSMHKVSQATKVRMMTPGSRNPVSLSQTP